MIESNLIKSIQKDLEKYINNLNFGKEPAELYDPIGYLMNLGGKRIRPSLTLLAFSLYKEDYSEILSPAVAVEVFHNFTLMHDDIMDNAPIRRGKRTVHKKWNANTAILSGDVMLVKAYDMLLQMEPDKLPICLALFNKTAAEVCEGQQLDMNFETRDNVSESEYLKMIQQKTAVLLGFSLQLGALLANADVKIARQLYDFGVNIGLGFQLKDDLLDVYADKTKFGKQVGGDIISNKKTFLLIKAKELAKGKTANDLKNWTEAVEFDKDQKVSAVTAIYNSLDIKNFTESKMESYFHKAFSILDQLEVENNQALDLLRSFANDLVNREK